MIQRTKFIIANDSSPLIVKRTMMNDSNRIPRLIENRILPGARKEGTISIGLPGVLIKPRVWKIKRY